MKDKTVAAFLALFFGIFGVHRFYLGNRTLGILYLVLFFITASLSAGMEGPVVLISALLGFIDFILLAVMPRVEFDKRYNQEYLRYDAAAPARYESGPRYTRAPERSDRSTLQRLKSDGIVHFRAYRYADAIEAFEEALLLAPEDPSLHFNLACCFSELEDGAAAFEHLELAFEYGFDQPAKLKEHRALAWLRGKPEFEAFVANGYRRKPSALPAPEPDLLASQPMKPAQNATPPTDLLEQIAQLGELRERGILDEEEFAEQKRRILGQL